MKAQAGPFDLYLYSPVPVVLMLPFGGCRPTAARWSSWSSGWRC